MIAVIHMHTFVALGNLGVTKEINNLLFAKVERRIVKVLVSCRAQSNKVKNPKDLASQATDLLFQK